MPTGGYRVTSEGNEDEPDHPASALSAAILIGSAFVYATLLKPLGFLIATPLFMVVALAIMQERNWGTVIVSALRLHRG